MKKLYIKQKVFSIGEKFTVMDEQQKPRYFVEGSFMKIPKSLRFMMNDNSKSVKSQRKCLVYCPSFLLRYMEKKQLF